MQAYEPMRRRSDFVRVQRRGRRRVSRHLVALSLTSSRPTRVGITISKAIGKAVVRNRLRRRIKALLGRYALGEPPYRALLIIARPGSGEADFATLAAELAGLVEVA